MPIVFIVPQTKDMLTSVFDPSARKSLFDILTLSVIKHENVDGGRNYGEIWREICEEEDDHNHKEEEKEKIIP